MASSIDISRDEWLKEIETKSPSDQAYEAYVKLERFVIERTDLLGTYRRNTGGQSHHATFNGSAMGHCSVIQILAGRCELMWKWKKAIPGMTMEQHAEINNALDRFRKSLGGSKEKSWEHVNVLRLGVSQVQEALRVVSGEVLGIMNGRS